MYFSGTEGTMNGSEHTLALSFTCQGPYQARNVPRANNESGMFSKHTLFELPGSPVMISVPPSVLAPCAVAALV